jgi:integrase
VGDPAHRVRPRCDNGLRRSEAPALPWDDVDTVNGTLRIDEGLVAVSRGAVWSDAKNSRPRRLIPLDGDTLRAIAKRRRDQAEERLAARPGWSDNNLICTTRLGRPVMPRSLDARCNSPSTRHTYRNSRCTAFATPRRRTWSAGRNVGELRAIADVLGHSPDMLMKVYAHALPESRRAVADRIGARLSGAPQ